MTTTMMTWLRLRADGMTLRIRRRVATVLALLGFVLVAAGAAHVNQSREAREEAGVRAAATAERWLQRVAVELPPTTSDAWREECGDQPLLILQAICPTERVR